MSGNNGRTSSWTDNLTEYSEADRNESTKFEDPEEQEEYERKRQKEIEQEKKTIRLRTDLELELEDNSIYENLVTYMGVILLLIAVFILMSQDFKISPTMIVTALMGNFALIGGISWKFYNKGKKEKEDMFS